MTESVNKVTSKNQSMFDSLANLGGKALLGLGAATAVVGAASLKLADSYEAAHARLVTAIDASGAKEQDFTKVINTQESAFAKLGYNASAYEDALSRLTTALNDPKKAVEDMGLAANIAASRHIDLATAAALVAKVQEGNVTVLKRFGIDLGLTTAGLAQQQKASDALSAAQQNLTDLTDRLGASQGKSAVTANQMKAANDAVTTAADRLRLAQKNLSDVNAQVDAGTLTGSAATDALAAAQDKVRTASDTLGKSQDSLAKLTDTAAKSAGLSVAQQQQLAKAHDAVTAATQKLAQTSGTADQAINALNERFGGQAQAQADTFGGKIKALTAQGENLGIKIGLFLIPILEDLGSAFVAVVNFFEAHTAIFYTLASLIGTVLVAAIGAYIYQQTVAFYQAGVQFAIHAAQFAGWVAQQLFGYTGLALAADTWALESSAATAVEVANKAAEAAATTSATATIIAEEAAKLAAVTGTDEAMTASSIATAAAIEASYAAQTAAAQALVAGYGETAAAAIAAAQAQDEAVPVGLIGRIGELVSGVYATVAALTAEVGGWIADQVAAYAAAVAENVALLGIPAAVAAVVAALVYVAENWGKVTAAAKDAYDWIYQHWYLVPFFGPLIESIELVVTHFGDIETAAQKVYEFLVSLPELIVQGWQSMVSFFEELPGRIVGFFTALPGNVVTAIGALPGLLETFVVNLFTTWPVDLFNGVQAAGAAVVNGIIAGAEAVAPTLASWIGGLGARIVQWAGDGRTWLAKLGADIIGGLGDGITEAWGAVEQWLKDLPAKAVDATHAALAAGEWLKQTGQDAITGLLTGATDAWDAVYGWLKDTPGRVSVAVAAAGAATTWLYQTGKDVIGDAAGGFFKGLLDAWGPVADWFKSLGKTIVGYLADVPDLMAKFALNLFVSWPLTFLRLSVEAGVNIVTGIVNGLEAAAPAVFGWAEKLPGDIIRVITGAATGLGHIGATIISGIVDGLGQAVHGIYDFFTAIPGAIADLFKPGGLSKDVDAGKSLVGAILDGMGEALTDVYNWIVDLPDTIAGWFKDIFGDGDSKPNAGDRGTAGPTLHKSGKSIVGSIIDGLADGLTDIGTFFAVTLPGKIASGIAGLGTDIYQRVRKAIGEPAAQAIGDAFSGIGGFFAGLPDQIASGAGDLPGEMARVGATMITGVVTGLEDGTSAVVGFFLKLPGQISSAIVGAGDFMAEAAGDIVTSLVKGLVSGEQKVVEWFTGLPTILAKATVDAGDAGAKLVGAIAQGCQDHIDDVVNWMENIGPTMIQWVTSHAADIAKVAPGIISALSEGFAEHITDAVTWLAKLPQAMAAYVAAHAVDFALAAPGIIASIADYLSTHLSDLVTWIEGLPAKIVDWIHTHGEETAKIAAEIIAGIAAFFLGAPLAVTALGLLIAGSILYGIAAGLAQLLGQAQQAVANWMTQVFAPLPGTIGGFFQQMWTTVSAIAERIWQDVTGWFTRMWHDVTNTMTSMWHDVTSFADLTWQAITGAFSGAYRDATTWAANLWHDVMKSFNSLKGDLGTFVVDVENVFLGLEAPLVGVWNSIYASAQYMWTQITSIIKGAINDGIKFINTILHGINAITGLVGLPSIKDIPGLAAGGRAHDGPALVGEGNPRYPEYLISTEAKHRDTAAALTAAAAKDLGIVAMAAGGSLAGGLTRGPAIVGTAATPFQGYVIPTDPAHRARAVALTHQLMTHIDLQKKAHKLATGGLVGGGSYNEYLISTDPSQRGRNLPQIHGLFSDLGLTGDKASANLKQLTGLAAGGIVGAQTWLGVPYRWGGGHNGESEAVARKLGVDCSGLVDFVDKVQGTTFDQVKMGSSVKGGLPAAVPSDLIFFGAKMPGEPHHVGIYGGQGQMINAPFTGTVVRWDPVGFGGPIYDIRRGVGGSSGGGSIFSQIVKDVIGAPKAIVDALGNVPGDILGTIRGGAADLVLNPLFDIANVILDKIPMPWLVGTGHGLETKISNWVKGPFQHQIPAVPVPAGGGAASGNWVDVATQVAGMLGQQGAVGALTRRIQYESGGNPSIVNTWDSNWTAGHPSVGLMQVISGTFRAYADQFATTGPFLYGVSTDPLANVYAGANYATHRYGSIAAVDPNVLHSGYDTGGYLPIGRPVLALNSTGRPERILNPAQTAAYDAGGAVTLAPGSVVVNIDASFSGKPDPATVQQLKTMVNDGVVDALNQVLDRVSARRPGG